MSPVRRQRLVVTLAIVVAGIVAVACFAMLGLGRHVFVTALFGFKPNLLQWSIPLVAQYLLTGMVAVETYYFVLLVFVRAVRRGGGVR